MPSSGPPQASIKTAVVGLGSVAVSRNLPILKRRSDFEVVGVIDRKDDHARAIAKRFDVPNVAVAGELDQVDWISEAELVCVGTGPQSHHALIKQALELGKDVLTEKPFTMTVAEGEELVELAASRGLILAIVHNFQFANSTQRLLTDIESGRLGEIKLITARQFSNPRRSLPGWYDELPLGLFYDESPHFFYLLSRIAPGPLEFINSQLFSSTTGRNTPASVEVKFRCDSGGALVPVSMETNFEVGISEWHITVFGEKGLGDIDIFRDIYMHLPNDKAHTTMTTFRTSAMAVAQHLGQHLPRGIQHLRGTLRYGVDEVFELLARSLRTREPERGISAAEALEVLRMQHEAIERAEVL